MSYRLHKRQALKVNSHDFFDHRSCLRPLNSQQRVLFCIVDLYPFSLVLTKMLKVFLFATCVQDKHIALIVLLFGHYAVVFYASVLVED
jgi:hypothetical protein